MSKKQIIAYIIVGLVAVGAVAYVFYHAQKEEPRSASTNQEALGNQNNQVNDQGAKPACTLSDGNITYDATRCEKTKSYRSEKLGIEFQVHESAEIIEEGNRIYVDGKEGQYVEKILKYNLQTPLEKIVELNGPTSSQCRIDTNPEYIFNNARLSYPSTYTAITVQVHEGDIDRAGNNKPPLCKSKYAGFNGMTMFLADSEHPTALLFFSIGQYSVPAGENQDWFHTVRFIK
jgi:hypothetical protein